MGNVTKVPDTVEILTRDDLQQLPLASSRTGQGGRASARPPCPPRVTPGTGGPGHGQRDEGPGHRRDPHARRPAAIASGFVQNRSGWSSVSETTLPSQGDAWDRRSRAWAT